ncbi:MAG: SAM-dependent methyltransferase, partial [Planctomycetes bacterium]|nr:SAM-dependent methyltransferase [Planctomycetota bacterium]
MAIGVVTSRVTRVFDVEKVTKKFYDEFKGEHADFLKFLRGIPDENDRAWYVSVMMNRLMFIYFVQKKGFLDGDGDYLQHKLAESKARGRDRFYRDFLVPLFFEGFAQEADKRSPEVRKLLGSVPYLNGGLFTPHDLEQKYGEAIAIPDAVFERRFAFFDKYTWHLDDRPWHVDNEINPDVLGFIFEKYINQKQMGAYYTKEDITGYICRNTILPFLLDKLGDRRYAAMNPLPLHDVEPYIYEAVKQAEYLPTETEREYTARQKRLESIRADFAGGKIAAVNDLITYNLDIEAFVQDWLAELDDPVTLRAFYFECLRKLTVLDPTCGSGAFLFAAMNILEPLYERCLERMAEFAGPRHPDFGEELARVARHPNRTYFICKSIIVHNLYGVDIMEEAVEICKLRLFLKLVAQVDDGKKVEPLPDIDFNIRAGNTLVGYATQEEVAAATSYGSLFNIDIEQQIVEAARGLDAFRDLQTRIDTPPGVMAAAKQGVRDKLSEPDAVLNKALANEYRMEVEPFVASHRPFHWYVQFHAIMREGGFDVIVGNPPYLDYRDMPDYQPRGYQTTVTRNLYSLVLERCQGLIMESGRQGFIVPI